MAAGVAGEFADLVSSDDVSELSVGEQHAQQHDEYLRQQHEHLQQQQPASVGSPAGSPSWAAAAAPPAPALAARRGPRLSHAASLASSVGGDEGLDVAAATSWQEVDRDQLSHVVLKLISSVAATAPTDDRSREAVIWHPTAVALAPPTALDDPLGCGRIDVANLRLERPGERRVSDAFDGGGASPLQLQQMSGGMSPSHEAMAAARQGKGAVGRFFSELTRSNDAATQQAAAAAVQAAQGCGGSPTAGSPLGRRLSQHALAAAGSLAHQGSVGAGPIPPSKLLPSSPGFDPELYLAVMHGGSSAAQLADGVAALERQLGESSSQLKQLVKQNFERFISCKTAIDDIYDKLRVIEAAQDGVSTEVLYAAIQRVQDGAQGVFGPILQRSAQAERIRSVRGLLGRFGGLFSAPQRVTAAAAAGDYEQVAAEWRKANGLIRPGPRTNKVWNGLYAEIEQRVAAVYAQQCAEVQDASLPAAAATQLVGHMLALQADGLQAAQGSDPLAMLLVAREGAFEAAMQRAAADHSRALGLLRAAIAAASTDPKLRDPAAITETQLLKWRGSWGDAGGAPGGSDSSSRAGPAVPSAYAARSAALHGAAAAGAAGPAAAAALGSTNAGASFARVLASHRGAVPAAAGDAAIAALEAITGAPAAAAAASGLRAAPGQAAAAAGLLALPGSRHLAELAPLSGLQPPAPASRIVRHTGCTAGEELYLQHLERLSGVLLDCLPGLWQAAGPNKLPLPENLPVAAAQRLQATLDGAWPIAQRLVGSYCQAAGALLQALAGLGPLREALLLGTEELATTLQALDAIKAPSAARAAVREVLGRAVAAAVRQLSAHLAAVPPLLVGREGWQLSLTHAGDQPITLLPEQLQEEVTVAMQYYQQLLECSSGYHSRGTNAGSASCSAASLATAAAAIISPDASTKPIREAYFACLEEFVKQCMAATDHLRPAGGGGESAPAAATGGSGDSGEAAGSRTQAKRPAMSAAAAAAILGREDWEDKEGGDGDQDSDVEAEGTFHASGGAAAAGSHVLRLALSDDVKLLLISSNLSYLRGKLVASLTQRFLLVLTGENASELQRCSRAVMKLAGRLDNTLQAVHAIYLSRKRRAVDRLLAAYVQADGGPVGLSPELADVSPQAQQLVQLVAGVQSEALTYAKPFMQSLLHGVLEHLGSSLISALTALPLHGAAAAAASTGSRPPAGGAAGAAAGCPVEALAQYFMDASFLEATLSKAGPPSLATDLGAAQHVLATRICSASASARQRPASSTAAAAAAAAAGPETPLAKSLLAVTDPGELSSKLQATCRKALPRVLERSAFTLRSLLADGQQPES